ncbi:MAG: endopolygalacturonase [Clostridia bacterium]|nr:endopolygalacturonase [Clostridia bacterium]
MSEQYYDFGIIGDGIADDSPALQRAINACGGYLELPAGVYRITRTLLLPSNMHLKLHPYAVMKLCGETQRHAGEFLISNSDARNGNENITVEGGLWDGNCCGTYNVKPDIFTPHGWSGAMFNFHKVRNLQLNNITVMDSPAYFFRFCDVDGFDIRSIIFTGSNARPNQDGLHFCGGCKNGRISDIVALNGQTNDDLIALNADDCLTRVENLGLQCGTIENIRIENVVAENCHTFLRMLSVTNPIRNIEIKNVRCGCRTNAINMDAARYCRTPLFKEEEYPEGVGRIENIQIKGMTVYSTADTPEQPLILCESNCKNVRIERFTRDMDFDTTHCPLLQIRNVTDLRVALHEPSDIHGSAKRTASGLYLYGKQNILTVNGSLFACYLN